MLRVAHIHYETDVHKPCLFWHEATKRLRCYKLCTLTAWIWGASFSLGHHSSKLVGWLTSEKILLDATDLPITTTLHGFWSSFWIWLTSGSFSPFEPGDSFSENVLTPSTPSQTAGVQRFCRAPSIASMSDVICQVHWWSGKVVQRVSCSTVSSLSRTCRTCRTCSQIDSIFPEWPPNESLQDSQ